MATEKIKVEQRFELLSRLGAAIDWDRVKKAQVQSVVMKPAELAKQVTLYLSGVVVDGVSAEDGSKVIHSDLKIVPIPFDPVTFIGENWKLDPEEHDPRNDSLTEVDFSRVDLLHCLNEGEDVITGEEKLKRLKAGGQLRLGATTFMGLWNDYQSRGENSVLETLYRTKGVTHMDFFGDVLLDPIGSRGVLYLYRNDVGQWHWYYDWLNYDWKRDRGSAVSQVSA